MLGREADLLLGLAQRRREEVAVAGLRSAAGQADLAAVDAAVGAHEQQDPENAVRVAEHRRQNGRVLESARSWSDLGPEQVVDRLAACGSAAPRRRATSTAAGRVTPL